jgi:two-component system probable response regulator PhcQ
MSQAQDYKQFAILYVDDEEVSLKYFRKAFEPEFRVLTAKNVDEACEIFDREMTSIGVVISDQRMPGRSGVELLTYVRQKRPNIIRILTTAYSDLESAIAAVNSGAIYKYVVKPWNLQDLRVILMRALDYFILQRERDKLLREKLSVLQRIIIADRVRSLAVLAAGLAHHIRNSMTALNTFLEVSPLQLQQPQSNSPAPEYWSDLWAMAKRESERILRIVHDVSASTAAGDYKFDDSLTGAALTAAISKEAKSTNMTVQAKSCDGLPAIQANLPMLSRCFNILSSRLARLSGGETTILVETATEEVGKVPGISIKLSGKGKPWREDQVAGLFTAFAPSLDDPQDLGVDLLSAFFIVHHHGGDIVVDRAAPGFIVRLPRDPGATDRAGVEASSIEGLFARLERETIDS